jgi:hypothetical protein
MTKEKVKAHISIVTKTNFLLENGLMINLKQEYILKLKMKKLKKGPKDLIFKIHMYFLLFQSLNLLILLDYLKKQWKELKESDHILEFNIFL